jgi:DNA-binding NarL/FixJ family response regulator
VMAEAPHSGKAAPRARRDLQVPAYRRRAALVHSSSLVYPAHKESWPICCSLASSTKDGGVPADCPIPAGMKQSSAANDKRIDDQRIIATTNKKNECLLSAPISVLIIEDDPEIRSEFARTISAVPDMRVVGTAGDVAESLALLDHGSADVLLVDLGLPDGSGLTIIREAIRRWPNRCDVMVVSAFADEEHVLAALEAGATGYLLKDSSPATFVQQIRELRAGGSPISPIIARRLLTRLAPRPTPSVAVVPVEESATLAPSERTVLTYAARGYSYDEVARLMGVSRHTVMSYVKRAYRKLQVHSKTEALYEARRMGLVSE